MPRPHNKRFRVMQPINRGGKTHWSRIGTAWENQGKTPCITVKIDSVPLTGDIVLFEDDETAQEATTAEREPERERV